MDATDHRDHGVIEDALLTSRPPRKPVKPSRSIFSPSIVRNVSNAGDVSTAVKSGAWNRT